MRKGAEPSGVDELAVNQDWQRVARQPNRLASGGRLTRNKPCRFSFDGRYLSGYQGDTLASALLANGIDIVGRSFKYARPRGILGSGVEEPNAIVQVGSTEATQTPNVRATEQPLFDGLVAGSVNGWPNAKTDLMSLAGKLGGSLMAPGFYYKTFMFPASMWETYETFIRKAAGLGRSSTLGDVDHYDHLHQHADVMIVGAGPAGLAAALAAGRAGARVILADEQLEMGGTLLASSTSIEGEPAMDWVAGVLDELAGMDDVLLLPRSTVTGWHDQNFLTIWERRTDHLGDRGPAGMSRHRLHKVRATAVILATGAHERPLVFANNDVPGCMTASAVSTYIRRYAVVPGRRLLVMTSNDSGYHCAFDWADTGREVAAVIDTRRAPAGWVTSEANRRSIKVVTGSAVIEARGGRRVNGAIVAAIDERGERVSGDTWVIECDTLASSGGWSPAVHLSCHTGTRPVWSDEVIGFVPGERPELSFAAGSVTGEHALQQCLASGYQAGTAACAADEASAPTFSTGEDERDVAAAMGLFLVPHTRPPSRAPKQFVDFQNDVTAAGIQMATREGFESIEHVKRYTAMGFGTDQGKTGNINGMGIVASTLGKSIAQTGTTVFRPNYTPTTFGAVAGRHVNELFDPKRFSPMQAWHLARKAEFEAVGQWMRPRYFPLAGESMDEAVARECLATRSGVGILDASTLGKIDIQGPDAREFLGRVYTNAWAKLAPGRCRYGLMCGEDGMVMDDGVTACLAEHHFLMSTTSGGAAHVMSWLELYHQTEWPELDVYFTSVTDHWATLSIAGPKSRELVGAVCDDIDFSAEAFGFMDWRSGHVAGVPARVFRISFTGELAYEIQVPAHYALGVWQAVFDAGERFDLTPYGTETMHVLRAEKGFIIVGQETDGSVTPRDLDMGWCVADSKPFSFIGKRGMNRADCIRSGRKQLVGIRSSNPDVVIPEGSQAVRDPAQAIPMTMVGHVTSSYHSAFLGHSIALALIKGGRDAMGDTLYFPQADGRMLAGTVCSPVFVDPQGERNR